MSSLITTNSNQLNDNYCLIFTLNSKIYGINIDNVLEVIKIPKLDVPQQMPKHVLGVITYNNISIQVIDTASVLLHTPQTYTLESQIIIAKTEEAIFGLMIDKTINVQQLKSGNIQALPYHSEDNLIKFIYRENEFNASIIDVDSVQAVIQKSQFEPGNIDSNSAISKDEASAAILEKRQLALIKKFETGIEQIYHDRQQLVIFSLENNLYSVSIQKIKEIVKTKNVSIVNLPSKYSYIKGIINIRGDFISVFDFKKLLNIEPENSTNDESMPMISALSALSGFMAPMFCATTADIDCAKAWGSSIMNAQSFSATPRPEDSIRPMSLISEVMTRNDMFTSMLCSAIGAPSFTAFIMFFPCFFLSISRENSNGRPRFFITKRHIMTLIACEMTVARAAPRAPMPRPFTNAMSPPMLRTAAMETAISGVLESPIPLKMLESRL